MLSCWTPRGSSGRSSLVKAEDMCRPWNAQVLGRCGVSVTGARCRIRWLCTGELQNDPDLPPSVARDAVPLAELMEAAPHARNAPAYAALVVESGIRNRLCITGCRMVQASEGGDLEAASRMSAQAHHEVDVCMARWLDLPPSLRRELRAHTGPVAARQESRPADTQNSRPHGEEAVVAGGNALRDLAAAPGRLASVGGWLRPEHFARPEDGALYGVMRDMDAAGIPVDPVTVAWEAARQGVPVGPERLAEGMGPFAEASARVVFRHAQLAFVAQAGRDIQDTAMNAGSSPRQVLQMAAGRLRTLESQPSPRTALMRDNGHTVSGGSRAVSCVVSEPQREAAQ